MDDNLDGTLSYAQFTKSLKDYRIGMPEDDMDLLFKYFDKSRTNRLHIADFMKAFIGELPASRYSIVETVYNHIAQSYNGHLRINDIKQLFTTRGHPEVRSGAKTEDEVLGEFIETFEIHHSLKPMKDYNVFLEEFVNYYTVVGATVSDDKTFEYILRSSWRFSSQIYQPGFAPLKRGTENDLDRNVIAPYGVSSGPTKYATCNRPNFDKGAS